MARARNIKPGFFTDAELLECDFWVRILYEGLWVHADRRGILADSAKQLKISVFPADMVDIESGLAQLAERGLIIRYEDEGKRCIIIPSFAKHQNPHPKEPENGLPPFKEEAVKKHGEQVADQLQASDEQVASRAESLIPHPSSLNADSGLLIAGADAPRAKIKRASQFPEDWQPTEKDREWAAGEGFSGEEIARGTVMCVRHHRGKGNVFKDCSMAWRNWMDREKDFGRARARESPKRAPSQRFASLVHDPGG